MREGSFDLVVAESSLSGNGSHDFFVQQLKAVSHNVGLLILEKSCTNHQAEEETLAIPCSPEDLIERIARVLGKVARVKAQSSRVKRRFVRYPAHLPCRVKALRRADPSDGSEVHTVTKNISRGGLCLAAKGEWKVGAQIECFMELPSRAFGDSPQWIRSHGRIVHVTPPARRAGGFGATIDRFEFVDHAVK
jgi:hypothetical protein